MQSVVQNMSTQIFVFIDLFQQYVNAIYQSPIFVRPTGDAQENGDDNPNTNSAQPTSSESA